ncbi:MAG TPA: hypothetical protein VKV40_04015 [Ktedonobacteraceae bacterium]|nr:hypothetical protein [Ktedonobacteraceae bacterium]
MELSLRLDTLGLVEMNYLRSRERYRDWPPFQLLAASRQARIMAYLTHDVAEQLHEQILMVEAAIGLDIGDDDEDEEDEEDEEELTEEEQELELENGASESNKTAERESSAFSPSFAQALERLNELARQRLPEGSSSTTGENVPSLPSELTSEIEATLDEEDAIEQLQEAFIQMMAVVRELAEELATDALKLTSRFRCGRTKIEFVQAEMSEDEDEDETGSNEEEDEEGEIELVMVLQLYEEGHARSDDLPVAELQLDVDDFERLHETLDTAFEHERRSSRRRR